ncbi:MAG: prolipoprotein diacylglyceryl transferase [Spirochaetales bacterium]|nr:prolipoprotein diacylglyceryl transferase [Spirochaetales bacterium]
MQILSYISFPKWLHPEIIPGLPLRWYGLMYLVAFFVAYQLVRVQVKEKAIDVQKDDVLNLFFWGIIGLLVGARLFAVTIYAPAGEYLRQPWKIILPVSFEGGKLRFTGLAGMSYHGGLLGAVVAVIIYLRIKKLSIPEWGDMIVTGSALGYTFGRLGNFINGELYGRITTLPWGMIFRPQEIVEGRFVGHVPPQHLYPASEPWVREVAAKAGLDIGAAGMVNLPRHPSQLYEALFEGIVLWAVLWFGFRKRRAFPGQMMAVYVMGYGFFRFLIEYVRQPDVGIEFPIQLVGLSNPAIQFSPFNFTTGQILNFIMILIGVGLYLFYKSRAERARIQQSTKAERPRGRKLRKKIR